MQNTRENLEKRRAALNQEIRTYPAPIAGCDRQFEHLLEQRARVVEKLHGLEPPAHQAPARKG